VRVAATSSPSVGSRPKLSALMLTLLPSAMPWSSWKAGFSTLAGVDCLAVAIASAASYACMSPCPKAAMRRIQPARLGVASNMPPSGGMRWVNQSEW
jgi:hypothetical protein